MITGGGLKAYGSWKEFARVIVKAVTKERARLIRQEHTLAGADDHKVTAPPVEPYVR